MDKLKMHSPDLSQDNIAKIRELFPGCVTEARDDKTGKLRLAVDFDQLRQELSDQIVEGPQERYRLDWPGKREALLAANAPIAKTLRPCVEESVDFDTTKNLFIEGDNLDALKLLQESYLGKVKVIYIDPPYNTGNDFIYEDDFAESVDSYLYSSGQRGESGGRLVANLESNGRFHSVWLTMMYARLRLARNLLSDDGVIFVSIDGNEDANLQLMCNEVFGGDNFLGKIAVVSNLKGRSDDSFFATAHNYLLVYTKGGFVTNGVPLPEEYLAEYVERDSVGRRYRLQGLRKRGSGARREDRPNMYYPFYVDPTSGNISLENLSSLHVEIFPKLSDGSDGRWRWGKETARDRLDELTARPVGVERRWDIFQIDYADNADGEKRVRPKSVWMGSEFSNEAGTLEVKSLLGKGVFDTPKPVGLLNYILEQSAGAGDVVLDFFSGSGTTAHAVYEFNKANAKNLRFICVQLPEQLGEDDAARSLGYKTIADIGKERIRRVAKLLSEEINCSTEKHLLDTGFRVLKIDTSNMRDIYYRPDQLSQADLFGAVDNIKPDRSAEDLLFQVLIDWGVDLSLPIRRETLLGKTVFFVDGNALVACFEQGISEELVKELAKAEPLRVVFRDNGFASDALKINVEQIFRQLSPSSEIRTL